MRYFVINLPQLPQGYSAAAKASLNPFRYRGYYYDTETGWYYLQSRYYNPQWGRFINADEHINANGDMQGYNMFAYCSNNPVMFTDPSGEFLDGGLSIILAFLIISAIALLTSSCTGGGGDYVINDNGDDLEGSPVDGNAKGDNKGTVESEFTKKWLKRVFDGAVADEFNRECFTAIYTKPGVNDFFTTGLNYRSSEECDIISGLPKDAILVATIHSHSGYVSEPFSKDTGLFENGYAKTNNYVVDRGYNNNSYRVVLLPKGATLRDQWIDVTNKYR